MSFICSFHFRKCWDCVILELCEDSARQMSCSYFSLLVEGGQWKGGGRKCSLSQSLVFPSRTGLLLQAADMRAILKRHHPQLHLTIYSTDTAQRGERHSSPQLFASLATVTFLSWSCVEITAFILKRHRTLLPAGSVLRSPGGFSSCLDMKA